MSHTFSHHSHTQGSKHNITQPINIDQYTSVMQQYTKTQSYMQCGTMSVKNLAGRLGVHDKTDHTLVS